ncbi:unnamed protein product, partial [Brenthis ino]
MYGCTTGDPGFADYRNAGHLVVGKMKTRIALLVLASTALVSCLPPPHPAVIAVRQAEELLPPHQRSPALRNPHLLHTLELTSLLHKGENPVFDREADKVPRNEIYKILTHAGFIGRRNLINEYPSWPYSYAHNYPKSNDSPFGFNPDLLQYL